ncbi:fumarylacetoacetate hydrolase family protein [Nitrospirillum viridazoti]|uniref:Fumarylacetoacetate (FAA) hydrolase n=1 Tax=Nitrospirillum amazonense TaxID=28077 RepID=A0A560HJJ3_9PROT|nr:fumarylacetoacetate hydrolase family protein [Nitrospirillum amazonense]TWB46668.1 fumarylacetoacetate (FAA) hydrolase [Nitrospirillum amazonense]
MKFATLPNGTRDGRALTNGGRDGRLAVVSRDLRRAAYADGIAATLQDAIERWDAVAPALQALYEAVNIGRNTFPFDPTQALAPLPRAWQWLDGSAYLSHGELMAKVFKIDNVQGAEPLMYQGISDRFLAATEDVALPSEADGIDFEGEFGVITGAVPLGVTAEEALAHVRLVVQINDWSLRVLAPREMKTGFGWVQAKPPCSVAPVAVTPDELGDAWQEGRVHRPLDVWFNGARFGAAEGGAMAFGFHELIAHAARTRDLCAGTIIGSGTVSNDSYRTVGSSCIAERRGIEILDEGEPKTPFMRYGDRVRMEVKLADGGSVFGAIDQQVVPVVR